MSKNVHNSSEWTSTPVANERLTAEEWESRQQFEKAKEKVILRMDDLRLVIDRMERLLSDATSGIGDEYSRLRLEVEMHRAVDASQFAK